MSDPYRSHPVRRMCADPRPDGTARLVVELAGDAGEESADAERFRAAVAALGGEVEAELPFDSFRVRIPEERVDELCALSGLATVETTDAVGYGGDAGEDLDPP